MYPERFPIPPRRPAPAIGSARAPRAPLDLPNALLGTAVAAWFGAVLLPLIFLSTPDLTGRNDQDPFRYIPFVAALLLVADALSIERLLAMLRGTTGEDYRSMRWLLLVSAGIFGVSIVLGRLDSLLYVFVMLVLGINFRLFWSTPQAVRIWTFRAIAAIALATALIPLALYGRPQMRWVGGIHPNFYGAIVITAAIFTVLGFRRFGWLALPLCLQLAVLVSSRYAILALIVLGSLLVFKSTLLSYSLKILAAILGLILLIMLMITGVIADIFLLNDVERGVASGMTGRVDLWGYFVPHMEAAPWVGAGFRSRDLVEGVHNGYLQIFLDNGLIIGTAILVWILSTVAANVVRTAEHGMSAERIGIAGGFLGVAVGGAFQPQLINFGDATGVTFLMLLMAPAALRVGRAPPRPAVSSALPARAYR